MQDRRLILIGSAEERVEIEPLERLPEHLPTPGDVRVKATVRLQEFRGSYSEVWLARPDLLSFVEELRAVVDTRAGAAMLEAMSPGELRLELRSAGSPEHFEASVHLGRHQFSGATYWPTSLAGGLELEADQLPSILAGFEALLEPADGR